MTTDPLSCVRCGYDLHGLPGDGRCPECGLPVERSTHPGDELRHAPPRWLASMSWGARLMLTVPVLSLVYALWGSDYVPPLSLQVMFAAPAFFGLAFAAGVWLLTRPQRRFGSHRALRWGLRAASLLPLVHTLWVYAHLAGTVRTPFGSPDILMLGAVPFPALLFFHLRGLARRALDPSLAEHCAIVGVGGSLSLAVSFSGMFVRVPAAIELLSGVGVLLFFLWTLYLMIRFTIAFARARRQSLAAWGEDVG